MCVLLDHYDAFYLNTYERDEHLTLKYITSVFIYSLGLTRKCKWRMDYIIYQDTLVYWCWKDYNERKCLGLPVQTSSKMPTRNPADKVHWPENITSSLSILAAKIAPKQCGLQKIFFKVPVVITSCIDDMLAQIIIFRFAVNHQNWIHHRIPNGILPIGHYRLHLGC